MGYLSKLGKKKADTATEPALVATKTEQEETQVREEAPVAEVPGEGAPADEVPTEELIQRNDSTVSKKTIEPEGLKTLESRDPEVDMISTTGSKADAPATTSAISETILEQREPEGLAAPSIQKSQTEHEPAENETEGLASPKSVASEPKDAPGDTPTIVPASPKQSTPTSIFDAISNCGCLFGNTAAQTEESLPPVEDTPKEEESATAAIGVAASTLGDAKSQAEEDHVSTVEAELTQAPETPDLGQVATVSKQESIVNEHKQELAEEGLAPKNDPETVHPAGTESEDIPSPATEIGSIQSAAEDEAAPVEETSASVAEEPVKEEAEEKDVVAEADAAAAEPEKKKKSRHLFAWLAGCRSAKSTVSAIESNTAEKELTDVENKADAVGDIQEEKSVVVDDKETEAEIEIIPSATAEDETVPAEETSASVAEEPVKEEAEEKDVVAEADAAAAEPEKKKKSRHLFAWLAGCRSAKSTVSAIESNSAEKELAAEEVVADCDTQTGAQEEKSIVMDETKTEDVDNKAVAEEDTKLDEAEIQKVATVETNAKDDNHSTIAEEPVREEELIVAPQDSIKDEEDAVVESVESKDELVEETQEATDILPTASALSDRSSKKKSKLGLLLCAMTRSSKKKDKETDEIQGMVRFMSHTERFERGFEVLLDDFSSFVRQCGGNESKTETNAEPETEAAAEAAGDATQPELAGENGERSDSATRTAEETEAEERDEHPEQKDETKQTDQPTAVSKQSRSSRVSFRSILGKKSITRIPEEVQDIAAVPSKDMSTLSRGTMEAGDEVKPVAGEAISAE